MTCRAYASDSCFASCPMRRENRLHTGSDPSAARWPCASTVTRCRSQAARRRPEPARLGPRARSAARAQPASIPSVCVSGGRRALNADSTGDAAVELVALLKPIAPAKTRTKPCAPCLFCTDCDRRARWATGHRSRSNAARSRGTSPGRRARPKRRPSRTARTGLRKLLRSARISAARWGLQATVQRCEGGSDDSRQQQDS